MHCFTGSYAFFKNMEKLNSYFSASGIITFKNSYDLQKTFSKIPNDRLLVETDSPFLAPIPMRGKKNEPSFPAFLVVDTSTRAAAVWHVVVAALWNIFFYSFLFFTATAEQASQAKLANASELTSSSVTRSSFACSSPFDSLRLKISDSATFFFISVLVRSLS